MGEADFTELEYSAADGVARIRLDRPDQLNAFTSTLYGELKWAVRRAGADADEDVVVLTGRGRAFATGGDLKETLVRLESGDPLAMHAFSDNFPWGEIRACPKVVIAAVNGLCLAGGVIVAMCCDISVAVESARFALTEGKVGIADSLGPALLHARVGTAKLKYLVLTGKMIDAREAERIGLVTEVVGDDQLEARVAEIVAELRETSPEARRRFKELVNAHTPLPADQGVPSFSPEVVETLRAFAEGRPSGS
ncbi:MAG: enoyl-CoA hydratase/isomerase family protein, partial [Acidimicrobiia bacterium]